MLREVIDEIFSICYEEGANVSDISNLNNVAKKFGLNEGWKEKKIKEIVLKNDKFAKNELDIHGVPVFIFNDLVSIEGAQSSENFLIAFNKCIKK